MEKSSKYQLPKVTVIPVSVTGVICTSSNSFSSPDWVKGYEDWFEDDYE